MKRLGQALTSSQLLNLKATPVQIIPAPGNGYISIPFLIFMRLYAGSNPYGILSTSLSLIINGIEIFPDQPMSTTFLASTTDSFVYYAFTNSTASGLDISSLQNQPVYIHNKGLLELTSGNGTLDIQIEWDTFSI